MTKADAPKPTQPPPMPPDDEDEGESVVSVAFERAWVRAKTEVVGLGEELKIQYSRLDALVVLIALLVIYLAGQWYRALAAPPQESLQLHGLTLRRDLVWLPPRDLPLQSPRLVRGTPPPSKRGEFPFHIEQRASSDPELRMEIYIDQRPAWSNLVAVLELQRTLRWGEVYRLASSGLVTISGHDWLRSSYRYARRGVDGEPYLGEAVEYATIDREKLYIVSWFGTAPQLAELEARMAPSLRVATHTGMPLLPQVRRILGTEPPPAVQQLYPATVMLLVADVVRGQLRVVSGGSGVIVGDDGSVLTNFHVVHDRVGRLHDVFVVARFQSGSVVPRMVCAGRPNRSKLLPDQDLALLKCDSDLSGRTWSPAQQGEVWPALDTTVRITPTLGQPLWVLGYPDVGGGTLAINPGAMTGWTGEEGGDEYIKTDAAVNQGNTGGPVVTAEGQLVGLATAFGVSAAGDGSWQETTKAGLVRPIAAAADLLFIARAGWTPRDGHTAVSFEPEGVEVPAEGIYLQTTIMHAGSERPVGGAILMVMKPGVTESNLDMNRLEDSVLAWGSAAADGTVNLRQPVPAPGTYSVLVVAKGFEPRFVRNEITVAATSPRQFNPWGTILLQAAGNARPTP